MLLLLGVVRVLVTLLIVCTAAPAILALFGFAVPDLDLLNHLQLLLFFGTLVALILAMIVRLPMALPIVAGLGFLASAWTFVPEWASGLEPRPAPPTDGRPVLKVMTHNLFGLNDDMPRVASVIFAEDPDIVAVQEFFPEQTPLIDLLKPKYPYFVRCQGGKRANIGLFSKIPFDKEMAPGDCPAEPGDQRTAHIVAGFTLSDGTHFTVLTTHFDWPFPIARQREELYRIEAAIQQVQGPLIVVGDFNSTPWSYAMKGFEAATGLHRETRDLLTYPLKFTVPHRFWSDGLMPFVPFLALDQVFERGISVSELHRGAQTGSDHLPVVFSFSVPKT